MTTPAYIPHASANMTGSTTGPNVPVNAQSNDNAIMDECAMFGALGWADAITIASSQITQIVWSRGVYRVKVAFTYLAAGPATGKVDYETHTWSNDSGASYTARTDTPNSVTLGKLTYSYDGSGNCTGSAWA